ncbi:hypothetical protein LNV09_24560 [Paucibacter sp. B2R-40]|uniref:hypothetical protein n=1 Tax=Paucibacter sp. B2R-40 TaxID=2893554 RepID=UPI0021E44205|nr:hypothetical protein [Paucibacter sp. B2R-40]MCV2357325.1 hypothetical protein [Paucibacter sp. B2R-40]
MSMLPQTRALLQFLNKNPSVRAQISAVPDATLLYAGRLLQPAWLEIEEWKKTLPQLATKKTLPDVLAGIQLSGQPFPNMLHWAKSLDDLIPWKYNGFIGWRALSGISSATNSLGVSASRKP